MKRLLWLVLAMVLMTGAAFGADNGAAPPEITETGAYYDFEHQNLEQVLEQFREEEGLTEDNASLSCYMTGTRELVSFAGDVFRVAASTYKLPLNMVYYDMEREGEISPESYIDGYFLPTLHYETIVNSNNDMAIAMLYHLGSFWQYREIMTQFYDQDYPNEYYADNNINSDYMLAVLWRLYCRADQYEQLLEHMKIAARGQYFQLYQGDYEIAHKYGYFEGAINDVGIIYTPEPVLVAAYTQDVSWAEDKLGRLAQVLTEYSLYHTQKKRWDTEQERLAAEEAAKQAELEARLQAEQQAQLAEPPERASELPKTTEKQETWVEPERVAAPEPAQNQKRTILYTMAGVMGIAGLCLGLAIRTAVKSRKKG